MAVLLARVKKAFNAVCDLADSYTETPDAGSRAYEQQLIDLTLTIDLEVVAAGLQNATWSHRTEFSQSGSVAHGAALPTHVGPIDAVLVNSKVAEPAPVSQIESERDLVSLGVTEITPHYNADGMFLAHNGSSSATVKSCNVSRGLVCQAPDECEGAVIRGLLSVASSPEGEAIDMLGVYRQQYQADLQMLMNGQIPPPFQMPPLQQ